MGSAARQIELFSLYLRRVGRAPATEALYRAHLSELARDWPGADLMRLTPREIDEHLEKTRSRFVQRHGRPPAPATYRNRVNALRSFYSWAEQMDLLVDRDGRPLASPMRRVVAPRIEQRRNDWLRPGEDKALLSVEMTPTERVVIWLLRWSGMRISEARSVRISDIDLTPGAETIIVRPKLRAGYLLDG